MNRPHRSFLFTALLFLAPSVSAEPFVFGVTDFPRHLNVLTSEHPVAALVRSAVTETLVTADGQGVEGIRSMRVSADGMEWRLRIGGGATFHSGEVVRYQDVEFSLARCPEVARGWTVTEERIGESSWAVLRARADQVDMRRDLVQLLQSCPLVERASAEVFGADLGEGANFVASGEYVLSGFRAGREIVLERQYRRGGARGGPSGVVVRNLLGAEHGLTALRSGTVDVLLTSADDVVAKVAGDDTLRHAPCRGLTAVFRTRLKFSCGRVSENEYVG